MAITVDVHPPTRPGSAREARMACIQHPVLTGLLPVDTQQAQRRGVRGREVAMAPVSEEPLDPRSGYSHRVWIDPSQLN